MSVAPSMPSLKSDVRSIDIAAMLEAVYDDNKISARLTEIYGSDTSADNIRRKICYLRGYTEAAIAMMQFCDDDFSKTTEALMDYLASIDAMVDLLVSVQKDLDGAKCPG